MIVSPSAEQGALAAAAEPDPSRPGVGLRLLGLLPLAFVAWLLVSLFWRVPAHAQLLRELGLRELPWHTTLLFTCVQGGGVWLLALGLAGAAAFYWLKASRSAQSLILFDTVAFGVCLAAYWFVTEALQAPLTEIIRSLSR